MPKARALSCEIKSIGQILSDIGMAKEDFERHMSKRYLTRTETLEISPNEEIFFDVDYRGGIGPIRKRKTKNMNDASLFHNIDIGLLGRFNKYHKANPHVYAEFVKQATEMKKHASKCSAWLIIAKIRWDHKVKAGDGEEFKINNDYIAIYARLLIYNLPEFEGFFELKEMKRMSDVFKGTTDRLEFAITDGEFEAFVLKNCLGQEYIYKGPHIKHLIMNDRHAEEIREGDIISIDEKGVVRKNGKEICKTNSSNLHISRLVQ